MGNDTGTILMIRGRFYFNLFLSLTAVFSLWLAWHFALDFKIEKPPNPYTPDAFANGVEVTATDETGHWQYQFSSPVMRHYAQKNHTVFSSPVLNLYEKTSPVWHVQASQGEAFLGNTEIHLQGKVELTQAKGPQNPPTEIHTDSVLIYPASRIVTTQDNIQALQPNARINSTGMKLDLINHSLSLFSHVHGIYTPPRQKQINITSNTALLLKNLGVGIFGGEVLLTQGESTLNTPELILYADNDQQVLKTTARGTGTVYTDSQNQHKPPFIAHADEIQYLPPQQEVYLIGHAKASQGENSYAAPKISYHINQSRVVSQQGRMTLIILPQSLKKAGP